MGEDKSKTGKRLIDVEPILKEIEDSYPPFEYSSQNKDGYKKKLRGAIATTCILTFIIGLIILSIIVRFFPSFKVFSEAFSKDVLTPEEEAASDAATIKLLIYYGIGLAVLTAIAVMASLIVRKKRNMQYEREKAVDYAEWENKKRAFIEEKRAHICQFCGGEITFEYPKGNPISRGYTEQVYNVTVTGYNTATLTPGYQHHGDIVHDGRGVRCSCKKCGYSVSKIWNYNAIRSYDPPTVNFRRTCGTVNSEDLTKTAVYNYVSNYGK